MEKVQKNVVNSVQRKFSPYKLKMPVTVAERSKACTVFTNSEAGIVDSNPTKGMDSLYVYVFILCLCCPVFR
jgi:hypothetical protein